MARRQAVFHFELGGASDLAACGGAPRISQPEGALATLVSESGVGTRVVHGQGASVACRVAESGAAESGAEVAEEPPLGFDVDLLLESGDVQWRIVGRVANAEESTVRVEMQDVLRGSLVARCQVVAETVLPGAAWLRGWQCPEVVLDGRPPIECSGDGGVILENCER